MSDQNTSAKDRKKEEARKARNEAKARVREFIKSLPEEGRQKRLKDDLTLLIGTGTRTVGSVRSVNNVLLEAIEKAGDKGLTEMDIFRQFKIGRPEMTTKIRIFLKTKDPNDRVWVKGFEDEKEGMIYRVVGKGPNPPKGWDGFVPADEDAL